MSYLSRYVPQPDIEDVMQRVFYEVWRVHDRFDPEQSLRGWVLGIARKRAIDHLRKRRDVVVPIESMREITGEDGREIAERLVWADEVRAALDLLPDLQREVIETGVLRPIHPARDLDRIGHAARHRQDQNCPRSATTRRPARESARAMMTEIQSPHVSDNLPRLLTGDTTRDEAMAAAEHLRGCPDCQQELVSAAVAHASLTSARRFAPQVVAPERDDEPPPAPAVPLGRHAVGDRDVEPESGSSSSRT